MNLIAFMHAYKFTHFSGSEKSKTNSAEELSFGEKILTILIGVNNPKPFNDKKPSQKFDTIILEDEFETSCWSINSNNSKGTVILCHGYSGSKSGMIQQSDEFIEMNYSTLLIDFMGCGDTKGYQTTIGYYEAKQVVSAYEYLRKKGEKNIILYGSSMGAVSIMRAISEFNIHPEKIIIECPFSSLHSTVQNRFELMGIPSFPMSNLIVFWGGYMNGFNGFSHNPAEYAKKINCSVLLMHGEDDPKVSMEEIKEIFSNIPSEKRLVYFKNTAHENYLNKNKKKWKKEIIKFTAE